MRAAPDVTVVIPTHNRWSHLTRLALPSALGQRGVALEIIVVDDRSTDRTRERLSEHRDPRVRVLANQGPRGAAAARNLGIREARGRWIAFLDDDDAWAPDKLRIQLAAASSAAWSYTAVVVVDDGLRPIDHLPAPAPEQLPALLRSGNAIPGGCSSVAVDAETLRRIGGFDEGLYYVEDWDLWLRLAEAAPAARVRDTLVATLDHRGRALFKEREAVLRSIDELLVRVGAGPADRRRAAEWIANEHARGGRTWTAALLYLRAALRYRSPGNALAALAATLGQPGLRALDGLLTRSGRGSHLDLGRRPPVEEPQWVRDLRARAAVPTGRSA